MPDSTAGHPGSSGPPSGDIAGRGPRGLLDAAPGRLHPAARETLLAALDQGWADPRRLYAEGRQARRLLDTARESVGASLGTRPDEISFHPSGVEALARAVTGLSHARRRVSGRVVASAVDQAVVLGRVADADRVGVDDHARVDLEAWATAVREPTALAVLQDANGEVGTVQPVTAAHAVAAEHGVPLLVDASASLGRRDAPTAYEAMVGDAGSFAGPPLGLLVVRSGTRFSLPSPRLEAEHGRAEAHPWVPLALAAAEALRQAEHVREEETQEARTLVTRLRRAAAEVPDVQVVGDPDDRLPHVLTLSVLYADGEALVHELDRRGVALASGSACTASTLTPSHVLVAMGALTHGNLRVTLPLAAVAPDRAAQVDRLCALLPAVVHTVRARLGTVDL